MKITVKPAEQTISAPQKIELNLGETGRFIGATVSGVSGIECSAPHYEVIDGSEFISVNETTGELTTKDKDGNAVVRVSALAKDGYYNAATPVDVTVRVLASCQHEHWNYTASGTTLTAKCQKNDKCGAEDSVTIVAPGGTLVYDGTPKAATLNETTSDFDDISGLDSLTISYAVKNGASLPSAPVNAGTYVASITKDEATASVEYTIKANVLFSLGGKELVSGASAPAPQNKALGETVDPTNLPAEENSNSTDGYYITGWCEDMSKPEESKWDFDTSTVSKNETTLYPVWTPAPTYRKVDSFTDGGKYLITAVNNSKTYALPNGGSNGSSFSGVSVTPSADGKVAYYDPAIEWTATVADDGTVKLQNSNKYLHATSEWHMIGSNDYALSTVNNPSDAISWTQTESKTLYYKNNIDGYLQLSGTTFKAAGSGSDVTLYELYDANALSIENCTVTADNMTYNGSPYPASKITVKDGSTTPGYYVNYYFNATPDSTPSKGDPTYKDTNKEGTAPTDQGKYVAEIIGMGEYAGTSKPVAFEITKGDMRSGVSADDVVVPYDTKAHSIEVKLTGTAVDATVTYSTDEGESKTYAAQNPEFTNVGEHTVYYKVTKANYADVTDSATVTIKDSATVKFNANGREFDDSSALADKLICKGDKLANPVSGDVTSGGGAWRVKAWHINSAAGEVFTFGTTKVDADITLYAEWAAQSYRKVDGFVNGREFLIVANDSYAMSSNITDGNPHGATRESVTLSGGKIKSTNSALDWTAEVAGGGISTTANLCQVVGGKAQYIGHSLRNYTWHDIALSDTPSKWELKDATFYCIDDYDLGFYSNNFSFSNSASPISITLYQKIGPISGCTVTATPGVEGTAYDGITVMDGAIPLTENTDYTVTYYVGSVDDGKETTVDGHGATEAGGAPSAKGDNYIAVISGLNEYANTGTQKVPFAIASSGTVVFHMGKYDGTVTAPASQDVGLNNIAPTDPCDAAPITYNGEYVSGWYTDSGCSVDKEWEFSADHKLSAEDVGEDYKLTLYANWKKMPVYRSVTQFAEGRQFLITSGTAAMKHDLGSSTVAPDGGRIVTYAPKALWTANVTGGVGTSAALSFADGADTKYLHLGGETGDRHLEASATESTWTWNEKLHTKTGDYYYGLNAGDTFTLSGYSRYLNNLNSSDITLYQQVGPISGWTVKELENGKVTVPYGTAVSLTLTDGAIPLTAGEDKDYIITYPDGDGQTTTAPTAVGTYTATITGKGDYADFPSHTITVEITAGTQTITASNIDALNYGDMTVTTAAFNASSDQNTALSYAVKDGSEDYLTIDATTGTLTALKAGSATVVITAAATADGNYAATTKEVSVTILAKVSFDMMGKGVDQKPTDQYVAVNGTVTEPSGITDAAYYLEGWYKTNTDGALSDKWTFSGGSANKIADGDTEITLYANWVKTPVYRKANGFVANGEFIIATEGKDADHVYVLSHALTTPAASANYITAGEAALTNGRIVLNNSALTWKADATGTSAALTQTDNSAKHLALSTSNNINIGSTSKTWTLDAESKLYTGTRYLSFNSGNQHFTVENSTDTAITLYQKVTGTFEATANGDVVSGDSYVYAGLSVMDGAITLDGVIAPYTGTDKDYTFTYYVYKEDGGEHHLGSKVNSTGEAPVTAGDYVVEITGINDYANVGPVYKEFHIAAPAVVSFAAGKNANGKDMAFNTAFNSALANQTVGQGSKVTDPRTLVTTGEITSSDNRWYVVGWYESKTGSATSQWDFDTYTVGNTDITLVAVWAKADIYRNVNSFLDGREYLIVGGNDTKYALPTNIDGDNTKGIPVSIGSDGRIPLYNDTSIVWTADNDSSTNLSTSAKLHNGDTYLNIDSGLTISLGTARQSNASTWTLGGTQTNHTLYINLLGYLAMSSSGIFSAHRTNAATVTLYQKTGPISGWTVEDYDETEAKVITTYDGSAYTLTLTDGAIELNADTDYTVAYTKDSGTVSEMKDAGTYVATVTGAGDYDGQSREITVTINKASGTAATVTAKTEADLAYTGNPVTLVTVAETGNTGKMMFAVTDTNSQPALEAFSENVPTETTAGIHYVWYYAAASDNYEATTPASVTAEIKYKVEFDIGTEHSDATVPEVQYVSATGHVERPATINDSKEYVLDWYTDADCTDGNKWVFETATISTNDLDATSKTLKLYAKWESAPVYQSVNKFANGREYLIVAGTGTEYALPTSFDKDNATGSPVSPQLVNDEKSELGSRIYLFNPSLDWTADVSGESGLGTAAKLRKGGNYLYVADGVDLALKVSNKSADEVSPWTVDGTSLKYQVSTIGYLQMLSAGVFSAGRNQAAAVTLYQKLGAFADCTVVTDTASKTYDGQPFSGLKLMDGAYELVEGTDYDIKYYTYNSNNATTYKGDLLPNDGAAPTNADTYVAELTGKDAYSGTRYETVTITPLTAKLEWSGYTGLTYGATVNVTAEVKNLVTVDEKTDECTVTVIGGNAIVAGEHTATATALSNTNYALPTDGTETQAYNIGKAAPTCNAPTGLTATYGDLLSTVSLSNPNGNTPGAWAWQYTTEATDTVGDAGTPTHKATFTPNDGNNYNTVTDIDVTINVANATISSAAVSVTAPAKNGTPGTASVANDAPYTVSSTVWNPNHNPFHGETVYTVTVTLSPKTNYEFAASPSATVNSETARADKSGNDLVVTYKFSATDSKEISSIAVKTSPTKVAYTYGDSFDPAGLVITVTYDDNTTADVTYGNDNASKFTFSTDTTPLQVSTISVGVTYDGESATISGITVAQKEVTVSGITVTDKTYNGLTNDANIVTSGATFVGKLPADTLSISGVTGTYASADVNDSQTVNFNASSAWTLGGTSAANYKLAANEHQTTATGKITAATISVEAGTYQITKTYDGTTAAGTASGELSVAGILDADKNTVEVQDTPQAYTSADVTASNATGALPISLTGDKAGNYTLGNVTTVTVPMTITKAPYTETKVKTISGHTNTDGQTGTIDLALLGLTDLTGAAIVSITEDTDASDILTLSGDGTKTYTFANTQAVATATVNVVVSSKNYQEFTYVLTFNTQNKERAEVTITGIADSKTYDGNTVTASASATGGSDDYSYTYVWAMKNGSGSYETISELTSTTGPKDAGSYKLTVTAESDTNLGTETIEFTINKATVTVTGGITAQDKTYDGNETATVVTTGAIITGKVGEDELTITNVTGTFDNANAGEGKTVTLDYESAVIKLGDNEAANYALAENGQQPSATAAITPATVTVVAGTYAITKTYDGTMAAGTASGELSVAGILDADKNTVEVQDTPQAYTSADVTASNATGALPISLTGDKAGNYTLGNVTTVTVPMTITKAPYTKTKAKTISGHTNTDGQTGTIDLALLGLTDLTGAAIVSITEDTDASDILTLSGTNSSTYTFANTSAVATATVKVEVSSKNYENFIYTLTFQTQDKDDATVTITGVATKTYNGQTVTASASATGGSDDYSYTYVWAMKNGSGSYETISELTSTTGPKDAGSYKLTVTAESDTNLGTETIEFTINKATVTVTAKNQTAYVGDKTAPDITGDSAYTVVGLVSPDTLNATPTLVYATTPDLTKTGTVDIIVTIASDAAGDNYTVSGENGKLTISEKSAGGSGGGGGAPMKATFTVTCSGGVTASKSTASADTKITLTLADGYKTLVVKDADGNLVEVTANGNTYTFLMPESDVTVTAIADKPDYSTCPKDATCLLTKCTDLVPSAWYHDGIHYCVENNLMQGISDTLFDPNGLTTRAMMMTILARIDGCDTAGGATWYEIGVAWAITNGISDGTNPEGNITREQFAAMLYNYAKLRGMGFQGAWYFPLNFTDSDQISAWANEAMHWCVMNGIINGRGDNTLDPKSDLTRAEAATMIQRFCKALEQEPSAPVVVEEEKPIVASSYAVTTSGCLNGSVYTGTASAASGDTVRFIAVPAKNFTLETLTVADKDGKRIEVTNLGNRTYSFTMPSSDVTVSATFMEDNTMLNFFVDVNANDYFYDSVLWAAQNNITKGTDAVHFSPNLGVSRAQVVTFLWRAAGCPVVNYWMNMDDVKSGEYYTEAVRWALATGITKGTGATTFSPDAVCTRGQVVTFLARYAGVMDTYTESAFNDVKSTDFYAAAVKWAKDNGVTAGTSATTFSPDLACTRAQVVTFLYRWMVR